MIIIVIALYRWGIASGNSTPYYAYLILTGLVFCLVGDIFLMFPRTFFVHGLSSFLMGHIFYTLSFVHPLDRLPFRPWLVVVVGLLGISFAGFIRPAARKIKSPVVIYTMVISLMLWSSWQRFLSSNSDPSLLAAIGATLFVLSDVTLAINKFKKKFKSAELFILGTYFPAIWLIASSI